jgi:hypothetical protein
MEFEMVSKRRIMIEIPEKHLTDEIGWFRDGMGEDAVRTYLLKHPDIIEPDFNIQNFLGLGIWFTSYDEEGLVKDSKEVDMLFERNGTYYIVETKQKGKYYRGWQYVILAVECFEADMRKHSKEFHGIVAVLATSSERLPDLVRQSLNWFQR